jgi:hypothetical protein
MSLGVAIVIFAIGAILKYAVTANTEGINLNTVGLILMWVGGIGAAIWLIIWTSLRDRWNRTVRYPDDVI